jgi:hypothetical protein
MPSSTPVPTIDPNGFFAQVLKDAPTILAVSGGLIVLLMMLACFILVIQSFRPAADQTILDATKFFIKVSAALAGLQLLVAYVEFRKDVLVTVDYSPTLSATLLPGFRDSIISCVIAKDCPAHVRINDGDRITLVVDPLANEIERLQHESDVRQVQDAVGKQLGAGYGQMQAQSKKDIGLPPDSQLRF